MSQLNRDESILFLLQLARQAVKETDPRSQLLGLRIDRAILVAQGGTISMEEYEQKILGPKTYKVKCPRCDLEISARKPFKKECPACKKESIKIELKSEGYV